MKKYFLMAVALFVGAVCFTSCGDDEIDAVKTIVNGQNSATIKDEGNVLTLSINYANTYIEIHTATFEAASDSAALKSYILNQTFASSALADAAEEGFKELLEEDSVAYKRNGNTYTVDLTNEFKGYMKKDIRRYFNIYKEEAEEVFDEMKQL
jgi:hypothetical protein